MVINSSMRLAHRLLLTGAITTALIPALQAQCETELIPAVHGPQFGSALALSGKHLVVGDSGALGVGRAYTYDHTLLGWFPVQMLVPSPGPSALFGHDVDVDGDLLVAGAPGENGGVGAAYIFQRVGNDWVQTQRLESSDGLTNAFGSTVALRGEWMVIAAWEDDTFGQLSGAVYVFENVGGTWTEADKLHSLDEAIFDVFGFALDIDPPLLVVGAPSADAVALNSGAGYVYELISGSWVQVAKLAPIELDSNDLFGQSVSVSGTTVFAGAHMDDDFAANAGAVYIFRPQGVIWVLRQKLKASDADFLDQYGYSCDLENERAVIGAFAEGSGVGAAYVVEHIGDTWVQTDKLTGSGGTGTLGFGAAVGVHSGQAAIGADTPFVGAGSVYLFGGVGTWDDLGGGVFGLPGLPELTMSGTLCEADLVRMDLELAAPSVPAALVVGNSVLGIPFHGGTLVPNLDALIGLLTNAAGEIHLSGPWPAGIPPSVDLIMQFWILDPAASQGFSASNAVRGTTP